MEAVANHHQPVCEPRPKLSVITHVANCLAHLAGSAPGWDGFAVRVDPQAVAALNMDEERLEGLVVAVRDSLRTRGSIHEHGMSLQKKIRVLVVDDSAVVRRMISDALAQDPGN